MARKARRLLVGIAGAAMIAGALWAWRLEIPHSDFLNWTALPVIVAGFQPAAGMPGQGSDFGQHHAVRGISGRSLGRQAVDMLWFAYDIRWTTDRAHIPAAASWQLDNTP